MKTRLIALSVLSALALAAPLAAQADPHWHDDIHHFHEHDIHHWATGHWYHGMHGGRLGWWWVVGPALSTALWYSYAVPAYPYPDPYAPEPAVIVQAPQPAPQPMPQMVAPAEPTMWYFCSSSGKYYPYTASCPEGWKTVPATPPGR